MVEVPCIITIFPVDCMVSLIVNAQVKTFVQNVSTSGIMITYFVLSNKNAQRCTECIFFIVLKCEIVQQQQ